VLFALSLVPTASSISAHPECGHNLLQKYRTPTAG
jgi:hypothetical protein